MKIDRLLGITIYLLNHKKVSSKVLADKFHVSIRTVFRDIEDLCSAGIPVTSFLGTNGGYEILESFKMKSQVAGENDYAYIISALKGLNSAYENCEAEKTLEKIKSVSKGRKKSNIILDFSVLREQNDVNKNLKLLENAADSKNIVTFEYTDADNVKTLKEVEPIALTYKWYAWYLLGFTQEKKDYRLYKLVRMSSLKKTDKLMSMEHEPAETILKKAEKHDSRKYIDIKLFCKSKADIKVIEYLNGTIEKKYENGDFIMDLHLPENEQLWFGTLLSLGNLVRVIEPESLKKRLCSKCNEILKIYDNL